MLLPGSLASAAKVGDGVTADFALDPASILPDARMGHWMPRFCGA
jgi:hypothetical protein